jgi:hypothetical protein
VDVFLSRNWDDLVGRVGGPLTFRFVIQPSVAVFLAIRAGLKDAREGRPVFFWTVVLDPAQRRYLLRQGWKDVGKLFMVAIVLDVIYQIIVLGWIYPGQTLIVATTLALVPYLMVRGLANRAAVVMRPPRTPDNKGPTDLSDLK